MRVGASANPYEQHQNAFRADLFARAGQASAQARVTTREIGFSIAGFGLRWQSQELELDAEASAAREAARREADQARAFREELDVASVRARLAETPPENPLEALTDALTTTEPVRDAQAGASNLAYALSAYTRTAGLASFEPLPGRTLGAV